MVTLSPTSGAPCSTFRLTVKNTETARDTFDLSLGGPAALVVQLALPKVTLAPGRSTTVTISTRAVRFAVPGALALVVTARSEGNTAVQASTAASFTIPSTTGMAAEFSPGIQVLLVPGTSYFLLLVNNTGNGADSYRGTITGTSGPVKASLVGLDGRPSQTIPTFRLPRLAAGAILLQMSLAQAGTTGTVSVQVQSLTHPTMKVTSKATMSVALPVTPLRPWARSGGAGEWARDEGRALAL